MHSPEANNLKRQSGTAKKYVLLLQAWPRPLLGWFIQGAGFEGRGLLGRVSMGVAGEDLRANASCGLSALGSTCVD